MEVEADRVVKNPSVLSALSTNHCPEVTRDELWETNLPQKYNSISSLFNKSLSFLMSFKGPFCSWCLLCLAKSHQLWYHLFFFFPLEFRNFKECQGGWKQVQAPWIWPWTVSCAFLLYSCGIPQAKLMLWESLHKSKTLCLTLGSDLYPSQNLIFLPRERV